MIFFAGALNLFEKLYSKISETKIRNH